MASPSHRALAATTLAVALAPLTASAQDRFVDRLALRFELAACVMVSDFQRNEDPARYDGVALGYRRAGFEGAARLALRLVGPLSLQASAGNWVFPSSTGAGTGWVFTPTGGMRLDARAGDTGSFFVDGNLGVAFTGLKRRLAVDAALGFEFDAGRHVSVGPVVRYGQTIQPDAFSDGSPDPYPDDARYLAAGLSIAFHTARPAAPEAPTPTPATPEPVPVVLPVARPQLPADHDGDAVIDREDHCPTLPAGPRPDPARPGCPERDADGDGLTGNRDRCPDRPETFNNFEDDDGCPDRPPLVVLGEGVIRLLGTINFATGSDRIIGGRSFDICDSLVALMAAHAEIARIEVQGHADDRGDEPSNVQLSQRRADAVRQYLVDHGIAAARVVARGYGTSRPLVPNRTADHRAQNRRVEVHVLDGDAPRR